MAPGATRLTMQQNRPELSFVLPAHNEARNVVAIAARLEAIARPLGTYEIVFVDDGSTDDTLQEIRALAAQDSAVRYASFTRNFGHQAALRAGLRHARGSGVVLMDCDLQHPPELVPSLVAEWRRGTKIVVTQRAVDLETSRTKEVASRWFYRILGHLGDVNIEPGSADFLLLDRSVVNIINGFEDQDVFLRGIVRWLGIPLATVPYKQGSRREGKSKYDFRRMIELAVTGFTAHSIRPLRLAVHLALGFAGFGALLVVYSIAAFFWSDRTVVGWTSLMAAIAILSAGQLLVLGIVGEYVGRILQETRGRPIYIIAETEDAVPRPEGASEHYLHRDPELADNTVRKLERRTKTPN